MIRCRSTVYLFRVDQREPYVLRQIASAGPQHQEPSAETSARGVRYAFPYLRASESLSAEPRATA